MIGTNILLTAAPSLHLVWNGVELQSLLHSHMVCSQRRVMDGSWIGIS